LTCSIAAFPGELINREWARYTSCGEQPFDAPSGAREQYADEAATVLERLRQIVAAYNRDDSDPQSDYYSVDFYAHVDVDWQLRRDALERIRSELLEGAREVEGEP